MLDSWTRLSIGEVIRIASGQVDPRDDRIKSLVSIGPDNLLTGGGIRHDRLQTAGALGQISGKYAFDKDAILYSKIRPNLNKVGLPDFEGICSADVYPIWVSDINRADKRYLFYVLTSERFVADASSRSFRTGLPKINRQDLESISVKLPSLPEQRKIAEILGAWDEALRKLEELRAAKLRRLDGLRAALLFGELRLSEQRRNWEPRRLSEVTHELTVRNSRRTLARDAVMGVTNNNGIVPMREQTISADISRYKRLPPRAFAYNPMRINVGSIAMNKGQDEVLVSPDYVVFACNPDGLDPDFFDHLRKTQWWNHYVNSGGSGSVRMRTYYADLAAMRLPLPEINEQEAITRVLDAALDDLELTEKEIKVLARQKSGLMQKLLTGEWRVNTEEFESQESGVTHA